MSRIYLVNIDGGDTPHANRLVRAANRPQAVSHVAKELFATRVASQDDLVSLLDQGVKVETASAEADAAPESESASA